MDTYYQLIDRDTSSITIWWKALHIIYFIIAIVSGFTTAYVLGRAVDAFGDNCILNASITFMDHIPNTTEKAPVDEVTEAIRSLLPINIATTEWGTANLCYFCQFTPLMCMINAVVWGTFFIICARGGAGYISDMIYGSWRIVYPALLFTGIATILMLISSITLQEGVETFCAQFGVIFGTKRCTYAIDDYTILFNDVKRKSVVYLQLAMYSSYICFAAWLLQLGTLILRITCIVDFQLIKITVWPTGKETVQKVINPDKSNMGALVTAIKKQPNTQKQPVAITLERSQSPNALGKTKVSFIDESPTTENIKRTPSLTSVEEGEMLLADVNKKGGEFTDNNITTSFSVEQDHKKTDSPSSTAKDKKSEIVTNVNPTLYSLPSNTSANASSTSSKETVQKVISLDESNMGALEIVTEKQPAAVTLKPSRSSNALGKMKVSFIDESPTTDNIKRTPSLTSVQQQEIFHADMHKKSTEFMVNTATTSYSVGQDQKRTESPSPTAKNKKPGIVTSVSHTLNSLPSNTSSNPSSASSKEIVQKAIDLDKGNIGALETVTEKQPVTQKQPVAVTPKPSQSSNALGKTKEGEVLPGELHKRGAEYMNNIATTSYPVGQNHKKTESPSPTAKNKKPGIVTSVSPTLNSLPSNTSSNASSTSSKETVQKANNLDKSNIGVLVAIPEKQPVTQKQSVAVTPKSPQYYVAVGQMKEGEMLPTEMHKRVAEYMDNTATTSFFAEQDHKRTNLTSPKATNKKPGTVTLNALPSNTSSIVSSTSSEETVLKVINLDKSNVGALVTVTEKQPPSQKQSVAVIPKPSQSSSAFWKTKEVLPVEVHKRAAEYMENTASTSFSVGQDFKKNDSHSPTPKNEKPGIVTNVSSTVNSPSSNTSANASSTSSKKCTKCTKCKHGAPHAS